MKAPRRLIDNQAVDLNPLFKWWTNHAGARPLTGWVHISGTILATNNWGWVVERKIERATNRNSKPDSGAEPKEPDKLLLLHPPLQDLAEFERLKTELQTLNGNRQKIIEAETQAKNRAQALSQEQKAAGRNNFQTRALAQESKQANRFSDQAKAQLKLLDQQIQPLKNKMASYPSPDRYLIDCFALDTGKEAQSMAVFDHGSVFQ